MTINIERNPVSEIYEKGEKPGFYEFLGWVTRNIERNPVSEIYEKGEKPGFYEFLVG
ncbi:hypothetical protein [Tychonema sp. LEGE 07196]|uniref:hypothetical protein n=1 Tax=Tychonema sp. LEGE 07196 TaxID=1828665 RepID=UPI001D14F921|nr:hypothetical protein [Tychonema sp. LEGE 07196]